MFRVPMLPRTLQAALRDVSASKASVRAAAVRDLVPHLDEESRSAVLRALTHALRDEVAEVRIAAATALADVRAEEALADLQIAIEDDHPLVRQMAIAALGETGDGRATERLRRALGDARPEVRFQAVMAFCRVCRDIEDIVAVLVQATSDADPIVCHVALRMVEELRAGQGTEERSAIDVALLARVRELLRHPAPLVRVVSSILLLAGAPEDSHGKEARSVLVSVARGELRTPDREDEARAIELCGELGLDEAQGALERRAFGRLWWLGRDALAWHARVALARLGHARARESILRDLGAVDRDRRTLAVAAAGRARMVEAASLIATMKGYEERADPFAVDEALAVLAEGRERA